MTVLKEPITLHSTILKTTVDTSLYAFTSKDLSFMEKALTLARRGLYTCMPNPMVGCVVIDQNATIVGQGWHQKTGEAHAEIHALHQAGSRAFHGTMYVTLEPCAHYGRTPPCIEAIKKSGVKRVFIGIQDPNPKVSGLGITALQRSGIDVVCGLLKEKITELNQGYIHWMITGKPFVRCKMAMSLDGRTAMQSGESKWITSRDSRDDAQHLRGRSCAILTGIGTVMADDPRLTFRPSEPCPHHPVRIIVDSTLKTPKHAQIWSQPGKIIVVCHTTTSEEKQRFLAERMGEDLLQQGHDIEIWQLPRQSGKVDLELLVQKLGANGYKEILIEAGTRLGGYAIRNNLIDELWLYVAPILLGCTAQPLFDFALDTLVHKKMWRFKDSRSIGTDWRFVAIKNRILP